MKCLQASRDCSHCKVNCSTFRSNLNIKRCDTGFPPPTTLTPREYHSIKSRKLNTIGKHCLTGQPTVRKPDFSLKLLKIRSLLRITCTTSANDLMQLKAALSSSVSGALPSRSTSVALIPAPAAPSASVQQNHASEITKPPHGMSVLRCDRCPVCLVGSPTR